MKKILTLLTALCLLFSLTACDKSNGKNESSKVEKVKTTDLAVNEEDIHKTIEECKNFGSYENLIIKLPENIEFLGELKLDLPENLSNKDFYEQFLKIYEYIYPDHLLNEEYFVYRGENSKRTYLSGDESTFYGDVKTDFNKVNDYFDKIMSGEEQVYDFIYNEDRKRYSNIPAPDNAVMVEFSNPPGTYNRFNRGESVRLAGKDPHTDMKQYYNLETQHAGYFFDRGPEYEINSDAEVQLLDSKVKISDAVKFTENYINNIPLGNNPQINMKVVNVETLEINDEVSALNFKTTKNYKGVNFDYINEGTARGLSTENAPNSYILSIAIMLKKDVIDFMFGDLRGQTVEEIKQYNEILSINCALKKISENLSDEVIFDVNEIELVYCEYVSDVFNKPYAGTAKPAWKIKLYNPNDGLTYVAFIDVENGDNFWYYTTENKAFRQN
ncbi:MAG: hypothetical protein LBM93_07655 [Oscillospiraceae bacterium]|jgi:hypothetical protein|nr:hypothetical protein [Oscillospiraceae bacterium]